MKLEAKVHKLYLLGLLELVILSPRLKFVYDDNLRLISYGLLVEGISWIHLTS